MGKFDNKVLCIPSDKLFAQGKWEGLQTENLEAYYATLLKDSEFRVRGELEEDPSFKQIIPQVILRHGDKYFLHRQVAGGEARLNSMYPLPLGGHVEEFDEGQAQDIIAVALEREVAEEADIQARVVARTFVGLIYVEDENPVNHVHVGLLYVFDLDGENVTMREEALETVGWVDLSYLQTHMEELTYWSRVFVLEQLAA